MRDFPATPPSGAPWYAIQSTVANSWIERSFLPAAVTQTLRHNSTVIWLIEILSVSK